MAEQGLADFDRTAVDADPTVVALEQAAGHLEIDEVAVQGPRPFAEVAVSEVAAGGPLHLDFAPTGRSLVLERVEGDPSFRSPFGLDSAQDVQAGAGGEAESGSGLDRHGCPLGYL